jgi:hypothetical protein
MKTYTFVFLTCVILTGCATPPRFLAEMYDSNDPCQLRNNQGNYPSYCGAGRGKALVTRDYYTNKPVYYTK